MCCRACSVRGAECDRGNRGRRILGGGDARVPAILPRGCGGTLFPAGEWQWGNLAAVRASLGRADFRQVGAGSPTHGVGSGTRPARAASSAARGAPPGVRAGDLLCHPLWRPRAKAVPESAVLARKWELKPVVGLQGAIDAASEVPPRPTAPIGEAVPAASGTASVIVPLPAAVRPRRSRRVRLTVPAASLARRRPSLLR